MCYIIGSSLITNRIIKINPNKKKGPFLTSHDLNQFLASIFQVINLYRIQQRSGTKNDKIIITKT